MKAFTILTLSLVTIILFSCNDNYNSSLLHRVERTVDESPDSARRILDKIDPSELNKKEMGLYGLLDAQTRHKLNMPLEDSYSSINQSLLIYKTDSPDSMYMKILFYSAVRNSEEGDYITAVKEATKSLEISKKIKNSYWEGKNAELLADMSCRILNFKEERDWRITAAQAYKQAGKFYNHLFALSDLSSAYLNLRDSVNACRLDDSIHTILKNIPSEAPIHPYHNNNSIYIKLNYGSLTRADSLWESVRNTPVEDDNKFPFHLIKADILLRQNKFAQSREILDSLSLLPMSLQLKGMLYEVYYRLGLTTLDRKLLACSSDSLLSIQSQLILSALEQPVTATQREYFQIKSDKEEVRTKTAIKRGWWISGLSLLTILIGIGIYYFHIKRKDHLLQEKIATLMLVSEELEEKSRLHNQTLLEVKKQKAELKNRATRINQLLKEQGCTSRQIENLYNSRWKTINLLCGDYLNWKNDKTKGKSGERIIMAGINFEMEKMKSPQFFAQLEKEIDEYNDNLISKLKSQCPTLSPEDFRLLILLFSGLSSLACATILDIKPNTFYSRKKRIGQVITITNPPDKDLFLGYLTK